MSILALTDHSQAELEPGIIGSSNHEVTILAFCDGLLPAAVAVAACDTNQLISLGLEVLSVALRLGWEIEERKRVVECSQRSWGRVCTGIPKKAVQELLDQFHESQVCLN